MRKQTIPIIGAAGNVGKGILDAFSTSQWTVLPIDPKINTTLEQLTDSKFTQAFSQATIAIYVSEVGNRDDYEANPQLGDENKKRFSAFIHKLLKINPRITIWYIGGSWTKRRPNKDFWVNDDSPNKNLSECNAYEKAKIEAEDNARELSEVIKIRFVDWASIVPNLAPNFSISKMITQGHKEGKITYSAGRYGRPLIDSVQAGEALITLIKNDDSNRKFARYLIPGVFVPFSNFAEIAKKTLEKHTKRSIILEKQENTPEFLKSECRSEYLEKLGFVVSEDRAIKALKQTAEEVMKASSTPSN